MLLDKGHVKNIFPSLRGEDFVLRGNRITARFALLCLVAYILRAHHVVPHAEIIVVFLHLCILYVVLICSSGSCGV